MNYKLAYAIGFHPWEDAANNPQFNEKISDLLAREEKGLEPPYGTALDLGCGSGIWGIELAKRGWQVTGVDIIPKALERAHKRVRDEGVDMKIVQADVTNLQVADIGSDFRLVLDTGTFHDFNEDQRKAMGRGVDSIAASDATVFLLVWPKRMRPLIRGASRSEIEEAFPGWKVTTIEPSYFQLPKILDLLMKPNEQWYRLRRI